MSRAVKTPSRPNRLAGYIPDGLVLTSSELIEQLKATGLTEQNARQILRRFANKNGVWRSEKLRLPRDERLFCQQSFVGSSAFLTAVGHKLRETQRGGMARCLEALAVRRALHKIDLLRLLAVSPDGFKANGSARRAYEAELAALQEIGVMLVHRNTSLESAVGPTAVDSEDIDELAAQASAAVRRESLLARVLVERLRRQNLFAWNRLDLPDPETPHSIFNGQVFSAHGFSYLSPLVRWKEGSGKPTPCPVLIDVYHGRCVLAQLQSFLQRIQRATRRGRSFLPSLGIIAAKDFEPDAWKAAKEAGLVTISFRQMFGDEALEAMVLVEELAYGLSYGDDAEAVTGRFENFSRLLHELKANPVVSKLRSIGFEALAGMVLGTLGYQSIELGRIVPWNETTRDVDVFAFRGDELRIVECKAYHRHKSLLEEDVTKFFLQTVPALKRWLSSHHRKFTQCHADIWTTGPIGKVADSAFYHLKRPKTDEWQLLSGEKVRALVPQPIRERSLALIDAIRIERTDQSQDE